MAKPGAASRGPALLCGLLYLGAFLLLASVLPGHFGFPLDDSWIHQVIARNLAEFHVLGFTAGRLSSGSSSPLWTLILTFGWVVFPKLSPVIFSLFVSCLILFAIGFVLKRLTEDDGLPAGASWCLATLDSDRMKAWTISTKVNSTRNGPGSARAGPSRRAAHCRL